MKTIEERADEYIGHPMDIDEPFHITSMRSAFIAGAKSEHEELTKWNDPNIELPKDCNPVEIKYYRAGLNYAIAYLKYHPEFDTKMWFIDWTNIIINQSDVIGWHEIHE